MRKRLESLANTNLESRVGDRAGTICWHSGHLRELPQQGTRELAQPAWVPITWATPMYEVSKKYCSSISPLVLLLHEK